jgi:Flp pilus assembly protein TadD
MKEPTSDGTAGARATDPRLAALERGELTLAEVEGMTAADAYSLADFGWMLLVQGRARAAALIFEALTLGNPRHAYFHALYGAALQRGGDPDGAFEAYGRALDLAPDETAALVNRAEILLGRGDDALLPEAVELLDRAFGLDPGATRPETRRARALAVAATRRAAQSSQVDL